jgi:peptidoglycan/LPS O-acetylase OafA/YrhL
MIKRFARLFPVNAISQIVAFPILWWSIVKQNNWGAEAPEWFSFVGFVKQIAMVQTLVSEKPIYSWNQPSWTLTGEILAYSVFPGLLLIVFLLKRSRLIVPFFLFGIGVIELAESKIGSGFPFSYLIYLVLAFGAGVFLSACKKPSKLTTFVLYWTELLPPLAIVGSCYLHSTQYVPLFLYIWIYYLANSLGPFNRLLSLRPFVFAGRISFSLYMFHWIVFGYFFIFQFYHPEIKQSYFAVYTGLNLFVNIAVAWFVYVKIEEPARRMIVGRLSKSRV